MRSLERALKAEIAEEEKDILYLEDLLDRARIDAMQEIGKELAASRRELKPVVEQLFADPSLVSRPLLDDLLKYKRLDGVGELLDALGSTLFANGTQTGTPALQLAGGDVPVLVVWGAEDRIIPASHAGHAPPGATVKVIEGAGHMVMMEKAGEVNALLKRHIGA